MRIHRHPAHSVLVLVFVLLAACSGELAVRSPVPAGDHVLVGPSLSPQLEDDATHVAPPAPTATDETPVLLPTPTATPEPSGSLTSADAEPGVNAQPISPQFEVGNELTIVALRSRPIQGSDIAVEEVLADGANYTQSIASYVSEGYKIYGLLTVPYGDAPEGGFPAIVFIHGYIPPSLYRTTERYVAYVDALARSGFVVFKIDLRGFGDSEGTPTGAYFSPDYTVDAVAALKGLQTLDYVNPQGIGIWGHSMAGNVVLRTMLIEPDVQAGVIWAGAVYSYDDMVRYAINDPSFRREDQPDTVRPGTVLRETYGPPNTEVPFWQAVSLTKNIAYLEAPLQIHHALDDGVVNIGYSLDLAAVLDGANKPYEFYQYDGGGHNLVSPYFSEAMRRTIEFFRRHL